MIPSYQKRVNKEIETFHYEKNFTKYSNEIINFFRNYNLNTCYSNDYNKDLFLEVFDKNDTILLLSVPREYPFKPYSIKNCNINFKNKSNTYFRNIYLLNEAKNKIYDSSVLGFFYKIQYCISPRFLNLNTNDCYCCNSITCPYNWSPSLTIENILLEYLELNYISFYNKPYTYLKVLNVYNKLFEKYFNKLPHEIIDKIFSYF